MLYKGFFLAFQGEVQCGCPSGDFNFEWFRWNERDEAPFCVGHQAAAQSHTAQWDGGENSKGNSEKSRELVSGQVTYSCPAQSRAAWLSEERICVAVLYSDGKPLEVRDLLLARAGPGLLFSPWVSAAGWQRHLMAGAALSWGFRGFLLLSAGDFNLVRSAQATSQLASSKLEICSFVLLLVRESFKAIKLVKKSTSDYYFLIMSRLLYLTIALSFWSNIGA